MKLPRYTTTMTNIEHDRDKILTGKERYPILGESPLVKPEKIEEILESYKGLNRYWDCWEKAFRAKDIIGEGIVAVGSLMIRSADYKSEYGYYFNPPYEFHAWLMLIDWNAKGKGTLIAFDGALPGVIQKGLETCDHIGPSLVGRKPVVLAGMPRSWMRYCAYEFHERR